MRGKSHTSQRLQLRTLLIQIRDGETIVVAQPDRMDTIKT
jgi:hypothetical protein